MNKKFLAACMLLFATSLAATAETNTERNSDQVELQKVVILSRHGIRSPLEDAEELKQLSSKPWPKWDVPTGHLTPRGFEFIKDTWIQNKRFPTYAFEECPKEGTVEVIADVDQRCMETAKALIEGLFPNCGMKVKTGDKKHSVLFSPLRANVCEIKEPEELARKLTEKTVGIQEMFYQEIKMLEDVANNTFMGQLKGYATKNRVDLLGAPYKAGQLAEIFTLEWDQFPHRIPGWDLMQWWRIQKTQLLHTKLFDIVNRDLEVARYKGSALAQKIMDSLSSEDGPKYTFLVGHDTNISNVAALFDLHWKMVDRVENEAPVGGYLTFEKWNIKGKPVIRIYYSALKPEQMHMPKVIAPPERVNLFRRDVDFDSWKFLYKNRVLSSCVPDSDEKKTETSKK